MKIIDNTSYLFDDEVTKSMFVTALVLLWGIT